MGSVKVGLTVAVTAFASGISDVIGMIPGDIGKVTSLIALITAIVVLNRNRKESVIKDLEIEKLKLSIDADRRTHARRIEDEIKIP